MVRRQDFYICNESHVFIFDSPATPDRVRAGVQWGYINRRGNIPEFSYCCCGEADHSNVSVHGPSIVCRPYIRKEVEGAVLHFLSQSHIPTTSLVREYHNISLTDSERLYTLSFYGVPGEPQLGFHMSGAYDCFGSPELDITRRNSLLEYAKKICVLANERMDGQFNSEFVKLLNVCD